MLDNYLGDNTLFLAIILPLLANSATSLLFPFLPNLVMSAGDSRMALLLFFAFSASPFVGGLLLLIPTGKPRQYQPFFVSASDYPHGDARHHKTGGSNTHLLFSTIPLRLLVDTPQI